MKHPNTAVTISRKAGSSCIAFLDLQKILDSLDHVLLLQRLYRLGMCEKEIAWFT